MSHYCCTPSVSVFFQPAFDHACGDDNGGATTVCIDGFSDTEPALLLSQCQGHYMHAACILESFAAMGPKCPTCSKMYGALHGE